MCEPAPATWRDYHDELGPITEDEILGALIHTRRLLSPPGSWLRPTLGEHFHVIEVDGRPVGLSEYEAITDRLIREGRAQRREGR